MKLKLLAVPVVFVASLAVSSVGFAQAPTGSSGECKDGSYTSVEKKRGACAGHGGVKDWYGSGTKAEAKREKSEAKSKSNDAMAAPAAGGAMAAPAAAGAMPHSSGSMSAASSKKMTERMRATAAPGGGAGKVWVNDASHVYHCSGDEWYGKTKAGEYMSEGDAKTKGAHAAHGKACG
ncbi:MAG: DUF3761 domain-containing protein [Casimicrobiaceae bacterium]